MANTKQKSDVNSLLPKADVHFHTQDESVTSAIKLLKNDWRFKRVNIIHQAGKLDGAIDYYAEYEAPNLLVVETDTLDESFMTQLGILAGHLDEGTAAVIIGPDNDVYIYRKLIDMGVSDYLVRPVDPQVLSDVIAKTLVERIGVSNSKLIAVAGTKGGGGVSTIAQALSFALSNTEQQKTLLMDVAGGWSYISVAMGHEPSSTLTEAAKIATENKEEDLNRIQIKIDKNLTILACGGDGLFDESISSADFELLLNKLMTLHPYVVIDLSAAPAHLARTAIQRANKIFVVSGPTLPSLRTARSLIKEVEALRSSEDKESIKLILNNQGQDKANEVNISDIETALETKVDLTIPYDAKLFRAAESQGKTLKDNKAAEKLTNSLVDLLQDILEDAPKAGAENKKSDGSFVGGLLNKIKGS
tara:strand:+ start:153684 stop:154937 length:1254 start_codon:yes stop_codon:yes gene_type:complete